MGNKLNTAYGRVRKLKALPHDAPAEEREAIVLALESALKSIASLRRELVTGEVESQSGIHNNGMRECLLDIVASLWAVKRGKFRSITGDNMDPHLRPIADSLNDTLTELHEKIIALETNSDRDQTS